MLTEAALVPNNILIISICTFFCIISFMKAPYIEIGIDDKDLQIISKLYWEQSASVRTENGVT